MASVLGRRRDHYAGQSLHGESFSASFSPASSSFSSCSMRLCSPLLLSFPHHPGLPLNISDTAPVILSNCCPAEVRAAARGPADHPRPFGFSLPRASAGTSDLKFYESFFSHRQVFNPSKLVDDGRLTFQAFQSHSSTRDQLFTAPRTINGAPISRFGGFNYFFSETRVNPVGQISSSLHYCIRLDSGVNSHRNAERLGCPARNDKGLYLPLRAERFPAPPVASRRYLT